MPYNILSFDGGGVRGVYSSVLLDRLKQRFAGIPDNAHLLAGTSTGGIIALGLASGLPPSSLVAIYRDEAGRIFDETWLHELADLDGLSGADYDNTNLKEILSGILAAKKLKDLNRKVLIPSFQLDNQEQQAGKRMWKPKFFHNYPGPDSDGEQLALDVALRTRAAPIYFPTYQIYVDGGVVANNPSMAALAQALDPGTGNQQLQDIRLFSIGTGNNPTYIAGHDLDWGLAQWARPLVSLMIDGVMGVADYQCQRLLGKRYFRLEPLLPKPIALDDAKAVGDLIKYANQVNLDDAVAWLEANFK